jgi:rare lipoprotein A
MILALYCRWAKARSPLGLALLAAASLSACAEAPAVTAGPSQAPPPAMAVQTGCTPNFALSGMASWYGDAFQMKATASGEPFDMDKLTAAHRWLPLNTVVRVTNLRNGRSVVLRINDRGPYVGGRVLDVSRYAAQQLGMTKRGVAPVRIEVFDLGRDAKPTILFSEAEPAISSGSSAERHFPPVGAVAHKR